MFDRELIKRKLVQLTNKLSELESVAKVPKEKFIETLIHYEAERLVELIVGYAFDINYHFIKELGLNAPLEYRESFKEIGKKGIIDNSLAVKIADSAGLRNLLVHHYDEIDLDKFYNGLKGVILDYQEYVKEINNYAKK